MTMGMVRGRTTKSEIRADFSYVRELMRIIDAKLKEPTTPEALDELEELANEIMAASSSRLTSYVEEQREGGFFWDASGRVSYVFGAGVSGGHYIDCEPEHPDLMHCARCGDYIVKDDERRADGTEAWHHNGKYTCDEWHGHDEHGLFGVSHVASQSQRESDDARYFVTFDGNDACHFNDHTDSWVVPDNPFTPTDD